MSVHEQSELVSKETPTKMNIRGCFTNGTVHQSSHCDMVYRYQCNIIKTSYSIHTCLVSKEKDFPAN